MLPLHPQQKNPPDRPSRSVSRQLHTLVLQDDLSSQEWLHACKAANAETSAQLLARWIRVFPVMETWVSDQGSHFKNKVMSQIAEQHQIKHAFTVAYSPWVNGTVESAMRHIRAAITALSSELKLGRQDWPLVLEAVMTSLNEAQLCRICKRADGTYRTPLEVMTGIKPKGIQFRISLHSSPDNKRSILCLRTAQLIKIDELQNSLDRMQKDMVGKASDHRQKHIERPCKRTSIVTSHFELEDFVVVRRAMTDHETHLETRHEVTERLIDISKDKDGLHVQVEWLGLPDKSGWTWQRLAELYQDVPERVEDFLRICRMEKFVKEAYKA